MCSKEKDDSVPTKLTKGAAKKAGAPCPQSILGLWKICHFAFAAAQFNMDKIGVRVRVRIELIRVKVALEYKKMKRHEMLKLLYYKTRKYSMRNELAKQCMANKKFI